MTDEQTAIRDVLERAPGSVRELAREAGVSHALLLAIRDGERRLTPATRDALLAALRRWSERCRELAEDLEAATPETGENDE